MIQEIIGSEATGPNRCGRARSITRSAGTSPPAASITARSAIALPGRWTAPRRVNPAGSVSSAPTRSSTRAISVSSSTPADDTEPVAWEPYLTIGSPAVAFHFASALCS